MSFNTNRVLRRVLPQNLGDERGQALQDYALGIGIFIVSVAIVLSFIPSILAPFNAPIDDSVTARADRSADRLTYSLSEERQPNILNTSDTEYLFENLGSSENLREYLGLSATTKINVTIHDPATDEIATVNSVRLAAGQPYGDTPIAASSRIVLIEDQPYRLTVRLW
ncbi:hypothetical protein ACFQJC_10295 [Haloferax namakaokahaiae]|uniref:Uncharacterized protein n=1 Tax=Haloferax namakaokahaiae TaxID=1748331 RepID=A0ABD5ZFW4_9EURY